MDGRDLGLRSGFHVEQPAASQYGQIELLGAQEVMEPTAEQLAALLDPYLKIARGVEVSRQPATGARVYCRGWSAALEWRHVPRYHQNARYIWDLDGPRPRQARAVSEARSIDCRVIRFNTEVESRCGYDFDATSAAQGHPGFDMYLSSARLCHFRVAAGDWRETELRLFPVIGMRVYGERARTRAVRRSDDQRSAVDKPLGDEVEFERGIGLPRVGRESIAIAAAVSLAT